MQFRVIVVTGPQRLPHINTQTQKHRHRQGRLQYTTPQLAIAQCIKSQSLSESMLKYRQRRSLHLHMGVAATSLACQTSQ